MCRLNLLPVPPDLEDNNFSFDGPQKKDPSAGSSTDTMIGTPSNAAAPGPLGRSCDPDLVDLIHRPARFCPL